MVWVYTTEGMTLAGTLRNETVGMKKYFKSYSCGLYTGAEAIDPVVFKCGKPETKIHIEPKLDISRPLITLSYTSNKHDTEWVSHAGVGQSAYRHHVHQV